MQVIYNGVDMSVMQETWRYDMEAVVEDSGVDYLFTRHGIVCRSVVNGLVDVWRGQIVNGQWQRNGPAITYVRNGATLTNNPIVPEFIPSVLRNAWVLNPVPASTATPVPNVPSTNGIDGSAPDRTGPLIEITSSPNRPPLTLQVIRQRLSDPRGKLFVVTVESEQPGGGATFLTPYTLESPEPGMICDCKNGPFPKILSVDRVLGSDQTYIVTFAIETYVNETFANGRRGSGALLSNRFSQTAQVDERSYTSILTEGRAIFRTDYLYAMNRSPDEIRALLMLQIPKGFQRENITVTAIPDVTGVAYSFTDRQRAVQFPSGPHAGAQKIAAIHRQAIINDNKILQGALASYERILGIAANESIRDSGKTPRPVGTPVRPRPTVRQITTELPSS